MFEICMIQDESPDLAEPHPDLAEPHRLKALTGVKIRFVAAGSAACHCLALDVNGLCYTWGRNEVDYLSCQRFCDRSLLERAIGTR